ncbi:PorP/SprF family type IX secretion system membrane protein [Flavobacteriaceae bacterium XHP0103]|uniref:PorP/SprF family type IX secretion system membrane protein n=1 Tax=Marixanthotalea marina TaxID=2844359 RepID=UPI002989FD8F|nr:PorP/SprF family type IX secretion system membrane protein [Marixanthotalea marina]MBU3821444.1 PorP/SprF family type IX secretion system membrane protein [Marixanthotalea marina]
MVKYIVYMILFLGITQQLNSQEDGVVALALPVRNSLKFNKYAINPTFSFVREQNKYITFTNKREWVQFNDAPQTYLFSFSGRFKENSGLGIGLFQQNYGVLTTFGGIVNYAYNAVLSSETNLTFGLNIGVYNSGINEGNVVVNFPDPSLENIPSNTVLTASPGINYGTTFFDFGVSINNVVSYNLSTSKMIEDNPEQSVQAHVMYTGYVDSRGFFDETKFSTLLRSEFKKDKTVISGVAMFTVPKGFWAQAGYNTLYGLSGGLGFNISNQIAIEYNYEKAMGDLNNFGSSHEITLAYKFKNNRRYRYSGDDEESALLIKPSRKPSRPVASRSTRTTRSQSQPVQNSDIETVVAQENTQQETNVPQPQEPLEEQEVVETLNEEQLLAEQEQAEAKAEEERIAREQEAARLKAEEEARILAQQQAEAERIRLEQEAQARARAEAERIEREQEQARLKAEEEARILAQQQAEAERIRLEQEAEAKAKAEEEARLLAQQEAEALAAEEARLALEEQENNNQNVSDENETNETYDLGNLNNVNMQASGGNRGRVMQELAELTEASSIKQKELLIRLRETVASREQDLKDLKEENDLSEQGIYVEPKPFKSISEQNANLEALKLDLDNAITAQSDKITEIEGLYKERLKTVPNANDSINVSYLNTIQTLKSEQQQTISTKENLLETLEEIKVATEIERKRRIKRAAYDNEQDRYAKDRAALNVIKQNTPLSPTPYTEADFDFGEEQSNIQILKGVANVENGYYLVMAVHSDVEKRDDFLRKVVGSGEGNIDFFFDVATNKYYIYKEKFNSIGQANNALQSKGSEPYNSKVSIVKIED